MSAAPKRKTPTQQKAANADKHPQVHLVPDSAQEQHPKPGKLCAAQRWYQGERVTCQLKLHHAGDHSQGGKSWRPRSGDDS